MNKTAIKIATSFIVTTIILLIFVDLITLLLTQQAFADFLKGQEAFGFRILPSVRQINDHLMLEKQFRNNLYKAIIIASILSVIFSTILGLMIGRYITRPLKELQLAIKKLRENNYKIKLQQTGDEEFDIVIDEFNKLTTDLDKIETLRRDLVSDVAHELKTPLTALSGQLQGVKDKIFKLDPKRLDLLLEQTERLADLVNKLQEYTRLRSKLTSMNLIKVNMNQLLEKIQQNFKTRLSNKHITLNVDIPSKCFIQADKNMLNQIVENLVDNAIKYSKGDQITIKVDNKNLIISDNGQGIPEEDLPKIFERFYRVEKSRNRSTGGLGLGLAIVKEMVEAHGWEIKAENSEDGLLMVVEF